MIKRKFELIKSLNLKNFQKYLQSGFGGFGDDHWVQVYDVNDLNICWRIYDKNYEYVTRTRCKVTYFKNNILEKRFGWTIQKMGLYKVYCEDCENLC